MALIPEAIGFSIVAGVAPMVGVYASFAMSLMTSIFGGRPGLISAAAGATALVMAGLVRSHGIEYMFAATILAGIIQVILGYLKIGNLMKFISVIILNKFVVQIPVVSLAAVMVVVAITTFNWNSLKRMKKVPLSDTIVMLSTVLKSGTNRQLMP